MRGVEVAPNLRQQQKETKTKGVKAVIVTMASEPMPLSE